MKQHDLAPWRQLNSVTLLDHRWCTVVEDQVMLPTGEQIGWWRLDGSCADSNPDWYRNLLATPAVAVEVGSEQFAARATAVTEEPERSRLYALLVAHRSDFAAYEQQTSRVIPVVVLERVG